MFKIIKNFNSLIVLSFICIFLGMLTFLTFLNRGFLAFSEKSLQILLIIDISLLLIFFVLTALPKSRDHQMQIKTWNGVKS